MPFAIGSRGYERAPSFNIKGTEATEDPQRFVKYKRHIREGSSYKTLCESSGASESSVLKLGALLPTSGASTIARAGSSRRQTKIR
jgi:hypothetical protein